MNKRRHQIAFGLAGAGALVLVALLFLRAQYDLAGLALGCAAVWLWARRLERQGLRRTRRPGGWHPPSPAIPPNAGNKPVNDPKDPDEEVVYDVKIRPYPAVRAED